MIFHPSGVAAGVFNLLEQQCRTGALPDQFGGDSLALQFVRIDCQSYGQFAGAAVAIDQLFVQPLLGFPLGNFSR